MDADVQDSRAIVVRRVVDSPPDDVFAVIADPRRHARLDGSGMVQGSDADPVTGVGQQFRVTMFHDGLGRYRTVNTVTTFVPGARLGWAPALDTSYACSAVEQLASITTGGHTYTYDLREVPGGTEVTQTYDWSGVSDPQFAAFCPFVSAEQLTGTLANLAREVETATSPAD